MLRRPALAVLAMLGLALPFAASVPAVSATGSLTQVRTMDRRLDNWFTTSGTNEAYSTPAVGDITGDATPEVVVAGNDGMVVAYRTDGSVLWSRQVGLAAILASPVLADVGGSGRNDVVVGVMDGSVAWLDGRNGGVLRRFWDTPSLVCQPGVYCKPRGFFATPVVADLDGDGQPEIIDASWDHQLYAWRRDGSTYFRRFLEDTLWSSPAVADLNGDGRKEIILGGDRYADSTHPAGGYLWVLQSDGSDAPGYPKTLPGQTIWSSPAVADINNDHVLDIVVGTGTNFADPAGHLVYAFSGPTGTPLPGWPVTTPGRVIASPAIADVNGDGRRDVVVGTEGGYVEAFSGTGATLWAQCNAVVTTWCRAAYPTHGQASIADVNHDGVLDVVSAMDHYLRVYRADNGALESETVLAGSLADPSGATIAEVGGKTWIVQNTVQDVNGRVGGNAGDISRTWVFTTGTALGSAPWPTFHRDAARTGFERDGTQGWFPMQNVGDFVTQQYSDFLNRQPDDGGFWYWASQLASGKVVGSKLIVQFLGSPEFGTTLSPVVRLHFGLFGRPPTDYPLLAGELARARAGTSVAQLADELVAADPALRDATPRDFAALTFTNAYGSSPSEQQIADGAARLGSGTSRGQLLVTYTNSPWATARLRPKVETVMTYAGMMRRVPDSGGFDYWVDQLQRGASLTRLSSLFQFSAEYDRRFP